jgi:hypothetical protein
LKEKNETIPIEYSWALGTLIYEKNLKSKISYQTPFNLEILLARPGFFLSLLAENVPGGPSRGNWQARQEMLQKVRTLLLLMHLLLAQITSREVGAPLENTNRRGIILYEANPMSGVFRNTDLPPSHRPAIVYLPPRWVERGWGGSIVRKTPNTAVFYICKYFV